MADRRMKQQGVVPLPEAPEPVTLAPDPGHESRVALRTIGEELARIEAHLRTVEAKLTPLLAAARSDWLESARNLVHYTALRQLDLRELQLLLQQQGLSSLGRSESFVMGSLLEVRLRVAEALQARGKTNQAELARIAERRAAALSWQTAEFLLHTHTHEVLGPKPDGRHVYVMLTAPMRPRPMRAGSHGCWRLG